MKLAVFAHLEGDRRSSIFYLRPKCSSALRHLRRQPARRPQQTRIAVTRPDELDTDRQTVNTLQQRQTDRGHAAQGPERAENRIAGARQTFGCRGGRGWRENGVIALLEEFEETRLER